MDAVSEVRSLLQGLLEAERDFETVRELEDAGEIDGDEVDRRSEEIGEAWAVVEEALDAAADRLLAELTGGHAAALRRYLDADRVGRGSGDGRLYNASKRALEDAGVQFGILLARALRARREPERLKSEKRWAEQDRERPALLRARLERTLALVAKHEPRSRSDDALGRCIYALHFDSTSECVPEPLRGPIEEAGRAVADLSSGKASRFEAHARVRAAIARFDAMLQCVGVN